MNEQVQLPLTDCKITASKVYSIDEVMRGNKLNRNQVLTRLFHIETLDSHRISFSAEGKVISQKQTSDDYVREVCETADSFKIHVVRFD